MRRQRDNTKQIVNVLGGIIIGICLTAIVALLFVGAVQSFGGGISVLF